MIEDNYYTTGEKEFLLKIARKSLESYLLNGDHFEPQTVNKKLWEKYGVFVSLVMGDEVIGCVGSLKPHESLILSVRDNVIKAADDYRSRSLSFNDLQAVKIGISILSELEPVILEDIKSGDGILLKNGDKSSTYLPSVWNSLSDKDDFLSSLAKKAGLSDDDYKDKGTQFFKYSTIEFTE